MIDQLKADHPVEMLCEALDCPRSSYYYPPCASDDAVLVEAIERILGRWPFYGYRRVTAQLKREGLPVNSKAVRRAMRQIGRHGRVGQVKAPLTTQSQHSLPRFPNLIQGRQATRPDEIWVADITYIQLGQRFIYLAVILDMYTRRVRGWHLGRSLSKSLSLTALDMALAQHPAPAIHHSDQGVQYAAHDYVARLTGLGVQVSMSEPGQPTQNAYAERFVRTFKEEHYDYTEYTDFDDAFRQIAHWLEVEYMTERIHSALGYLTPAEFEAAYYHRVSLAMSA
jgi:transposase InsO family protein